MVRYVESHELREGWRNAVHPWERLIWARKHWQAQTETLDRTAKQAAQALGLKEGTYRAYERAPGSSKNIGLNHQDAIRFARKFKVSWQWLIAGEGTPFDDELPEAQERVLRVMSSLPESKQRALAEMIETLTLGVTGTEG